MLATRIVRFESHHGNEVEVARLTTLSEAVEFAIAAGDPIAWLVVGTRPPVWLSAASLVGETDPVGAVIRLYRLAREALSAEGVPVAGVDAQLPLAPDGSIPAGL